MNINFKKSTVSFRTFNKLCTYLSVILIDLSLVITLFIDLDSTPVIFWITLLCGQYLGFSKILTRNKKDKAFIVSLVLEIANTVTFYTLHKVYTVQTASMINAAVTVLFGIYCIFIRKEKSESYEESNNPRYQ